jgi:hypothetical protein
LSQRASTKARSQELERARHGEALVRAMRHTPPAARVEHRNAEAPAMAPLQRAEGGVLRHGAARCAARAAKQGCGQRRAAAHQDRHGDLLRHRVKSLTAALQGGSTDASATNSPDFGPKRSDPDERDAMTRLATGLGAALGAAALALAAGSAEAATFKADYAVTLAGFPIATADLVSSIDGTTYKTQIQARTTGLAGVFASGKGGAVASGSLAGGQPVPASFALTSRTSSSQVAVRMGLAQG